jgi:small subunit ribosomal protein S6
MPEVQQRHYECMYILAPTLSDEEVQALAQHMEAAVTATGGRVEGHYEFGRRTFAYRLGGWREGLYRLMYFAGSGETVEEVKHAASADERILRALVVIANPAARYRSDKEATEEKAAAAQPAPAEPAEAGQTEAQPQAEAAEQS